MISPDIPTKDEDARFVDMWIRVAKGLLADGKIKVHPLRRIAWHFG